MISDIKYMYDTNRDGTYPIPHSASNLFDKTHVAYVQAHLSEGATAIFPTIIPLFRVKELVNHDGKVASVQLEVKYVTYSQNLGMRLQESEWIKVPRVKDTNGL